MPDPAVQHVPGAFDLDDTAMPTTQGRCIVTGLVGACAHLLEGHPLLVGVVDVVLVHLVCQEHQLVLGCKLDDVLLVLLGKHLHAKHVT